VRDRQAFFLIARGANEVDQSETRAVVVAIDQAFVREDCGRADRTRRADWFTQVGARQVFADAFKREKVKSFVLADRTTDGAAVLLAMKIV
jgi:hypothetical protein